MIRLTGGKFRGRSVATPKFTPHTPVRPTQSKLRQALFNSVQNLIHGAKVLDLFAGSGALGFEALSREANHVTFIEIAKSNLKLIRKNAEDLGVLDQVEIIGESVAVERLWPRIKQLCPYDLVLADPPYAAGWELRLIEELPWAEILAPGGLFCLEWGIQKSTVSNLPERTAFLVKTREKNYGDSVLTTYQRT